MSWSTLVAQLAVGRRPLTTAARHEAELNPQIEDMMNDLMEVADLARKEIAKLKTAPLGLDEDGQG